MKIEGFTVSIGYGDILAETAKYNHGLFDRWIIATEEEDKETRQVCRKYNLDCILTNDHKRDGDFNKGKVIERILRMSTIGAYRCHIDADIVLPSNFRHVLQTAHLDENKIYGCDRFMVKSWEDWQKLLAKGWLHGLTENPYCLKFPEGYEVGARWTSQESGWVCIGFLQIWSGNSDEWWGNRVKKYPDHHGNCCRSDVQHALQWDRRQRELIPELIVAHLESQSAPNGANWKGRKTKRFGPPMASMAPESKKNDCPS